MVIRNEGDDADRVREKELLRHAVTILEKSVLACGDALNGDFSEEYKNDLVSSLGFTAGEARFLEALIKRKRTVVQVALALGATPIQVRRRCLDLAVRLADSAGFDFEEEN